MRISRVSNEIKGFQIVSTSNGEIVGKVEDVLIDSSNLEIAAIVTSKGNLLDSTIKAIPRDEIQLWGEDVILTGKSNVIVEQDQLPGIEEWESTSNDIKGKDVLNTQGEKIAQLKDVMIDSKAKIIGYDLDKVSIEGPIADSKRIHVNATHGFGGDALIIDTSKLYQWSIPEE